MPPFSSFPHRRFRFRPDAIVGEADGPADDLGHRRRDRLQRHLRHALSLRPLEMREQRHLRAHVGERSNGRRHALDPRHVGDHAILDRHVQVDAEKHALAGKLARILEGPKLHLCSLPGLNGSLLSPEGAG